MSTGTYEQLSARVDRGRTITTQMRRLHRRRRAAFPVQPPRSAASLLTESAQIAPSPFIVSSMAMAARERYMTPAPRSVRSARFCPRSRLHPRARPDGHGPSAPAAGVLSRPGRAPVRLLCCLHVRLPLIVWRNSLISRPTQILWMLNHPDLYILSG
jgi:hypothetical protein